LQVFDTPASGYFDVVDVPASVRVAKDNFFDLNDRWLQGWLANDQYLRLDWQDRATPPLPRIDAATSLPAAPPATTPPGTASAESQTGEVYRARLEVMRPAFVLFRMTWHPDWHVYVDGKAMETVMLSPGFVGAAVAAGSHRVECRYQPGFWKIWMAFGGIMATLLIGVLERRWRVTKRT
jgi:hypothetical protein